jgi:hypothetical protein
MAKRVPLWLTDETGRSWVNNPALVVVGNRPRKSRSPSRRNSLMAKRRRKRNKLHGAALAAHQRKANRGKRRRTNRRAHARTAPARRSNRRRAHTRRRTNVSHSRRRVSVATRRRRRSNSHHTTRRRRRHNASHSRRRVHVKARRRHNVSVRRRHHNRRRRRNPDFVGMGKGIVKDITSTVMNGAVDSLFGAGGWLAAQAGSSLIPITDTSTSEILGLQPIDTLKRLGTSVLLGVVAKKMRVSDVHARMLVMGGFLNTVLSVVESLIPTSVAGNLGLYPGAPQMAGMGDAFVASGFFPPLPGGTHGDYHGDPAFMGAYYQGGGH